MKEKLKDLTRDAWNVPNMLTMFRLILVPVFIVLYMKDLPYAALAVFCIASLTDMLDGYLARKNNQITSFGKLMDPLADKLLVISSLICHALKGVFPWIAIILVAFKEICMVAGGLLLLNKKDIVVHANFFGKLATCFFVGALIAGFFHTWFLSVNVPVDVILLWASVVLSYTAAFIYLIQTIQALKTGSSGNT